MTVSEHSGCFISLHELAEGDVRRMWVDPLCIRSFGMGQDGKTFVNYVFGSERVFGFVKESPEDICKRISGVLKRETTNA